ncbi:MAG: adenylate/guanylate cyclase domain-containing protein [Vicinamibacterales bacterium]
MRKLAIGLAIGALAWAIAFGLGRLDVFKDQELSTYDLRLVASRRAGFAKLDAVRTDLAIVEIDETSLRLLEPTFGRWPWPRVVHSAVVDFLAKAQSRVIAYDVLFVDRDLRSAFPLGDSGTVMSGAESDAALVESVKRAGNVVMAAEALYEGSASSTGAGVPAAPALPGVNYEPGPTFLQRPHLRLPFADLANVTAGVGHTILELDPDGTARRVLPFVIAQGRPVPWLGLSAALVGNRIPASALAVEPDALRIGQAHLPLLSAPAITTDQGQTSSRQLLLRLRGPYADEAGNRTYPTYSFVDLLRSEDLMLNGATPLVSPEEFKGKYVFIGTSAAGLRDIYPSPFGGPSMPGVHLHAATVDDVMSQRFMRKASAAVDAMTTGAAALLAGVVAVTLPVGWAVAVVIAAGALLVWALTAAIGAGVWVALVTPVLALSIATFGGTAWQYFVEGRQKRLMKQLFGRYVSPDVFAHLVADPTLAQLGGQRREMTVLFSDIRGFTAAAEKATPEAVVSQLNEYFSAMVAVLFRHHGTLDKFVGDMVMGLFGAPVADPHHADHAVAAALEMVSELARLNEAWRVQGRPTVEIGIGINSGEMIAGNIGSDTVMSYTVIGDAVNLGSRLESATKDHGAKILISEAVRSRLTIPVETREIGAISVKNRAQSVVVHAVIPQ